MADDSKTPRAADYRLARIGAATALVVVIAFLLVFDALSPDYQASDVTLTALLGTVMTLLGIEALSLLGRRNGPK